MSEHQKVCVLCGQSCAGQARIRNAKGQYAHRACVEAKREHEKPREPEHHDALGGDMDDTLDEMAAYEQAGPEIAAGSGSACPGCGHRLAQRAVVCMGCGYDIRSGKQLRTSAAKERRERSESSIARAGGAMASSVMSALVVPMICGCVAGMVGAAIWAGISYGTELQFGALAWGLGGLVGIGVNLGSRDTGGMFYGLIGAAIALLAVLAGNFLTVSLLVAKYMELMEPDEVPYEMVMQVLVDEIALEWVEEDREIRWPKEWKAWDQAEWPDDYPRDLRVETETRWEGMAPDQQLDRRTAIAEVTKANSQLIENAGFSEIMSRPRTVIWTLFAVCTAFMVAAYE